MYRGTTPRLVINLNTTLDLNNIKEMWLTFKINANKDITYTMDDLDLDVANKKVTVRMKQEDTLTLSSGKCKVQLRILMNNDLAFASNMKDVDVNSILKEGVIE